jgi:hypothetical protein
MDDDDSYIMAGASWEKPSFLPNSSLYPGINGSLVFKAKWVVFEGLYIQGSYGTNYPAAGSPEYQFSSFDKQTFFTIKVGKVFGN